MHVCVLYSGMREPQALRDYASGRVAEDAGGRHSLLGAGTHRVLVSHRHTGTPQHSRTRHTTTHVVVGVGGGGNVVVVVVVVVVVGTDRHGNAVEEIKKWTENG